MPHQYSCNQCDSTAPRRDHREDAEHDQDEHRAAAHGHLRPNAGDAIHRVHAGGRGKFGLPPNTQWAALFFIAIIILEKCDL